ncbi:SAM-dependent methyltransferase [Streptomyces sp. TLI_185]|uniref:SAM-dependent methyltransferase n=1 Tax=Streptomyces sp. TLI_185 TaxID=2485151 RepID=UPI000F505937|nr:SAM-dependent methyltransferase [Streptomyces sp. TLI_185]RPF24885.1 8-demethyl-8-(2,3,4-trimethoxy-alpha-L-rhamnosyl)tetracenomycin-C O-methyltransferase [Streptomyces sp. TLI_185]
MNAKYDEWDITVSVGLTALAACSARAVESDRPDRLVDDPYARDLVLAARAPKPLPTSVAEANAAPDSMMSSRFTGVRSRVFDDFFATSALDGVRQAVVLAAGLDVRAYRLPWPPGTVLYEIDQPGVLQYKAEVMQHLGVAAGCDRYAVGVDLRKDWVSALRAAGFDPARPTAWIGEGFLPYLPAKAEADMFSAITALSAPGSQVCVEFMPTDVVERFAAHPTMQGTSDSLGVDIGDMWNAEPRQAAADRLREIGWNVTVDSVLDRGRRLGVPLDEEFAGIVDMLGVPRDSALAAVFGECAFVTAQLPR